MELTRRYITMAVIILTTIVAIMAIFTPTAFQVFEMLIPILMLILGYYFGRKR